MGSNFLTKLRNYNSPAYIIAEIGNNHNGKFKKAELLIKEAAKAGANAVKFQTWKANDIHNPLQLSKNFLKNFNVPKKYKFLIDYLKNIELDYVYYNKLKKIAKFYNVDLISTPASVEALNFLIKLKISSIKIASMDINNSLLLKTCNLQIKKKIPIIISTGMSVISEINYAVNKLKNCNVAILHCVSNYPTSYEDASIQNISMLREKYKKHVIGYSSHCPGIETEIGARSMGALIIEKHFTTDKKDKSLAEHHFSLDKKEFKDMVKAIRTIELSLGGYNRVLCKEEKLAVKKFRRSVVAVKNIQKNEKLSSKNVSLIRPGNGISAKEYFTVLGKKTNKSIKAFHPIKWKNLC